jgi:hypothetical protein
MTVPIRVTCPACQRPLRIADGVMQPSVTCPHCLARVANPQAGTAGGQDDLAVEYEVRRDVRKTSWLLIVLACLGTLGLLSAIRVSRDVIKSIEDLLMGLASLGALAALSAAYVLWRRPGRTPLATAGRIVVGTLVLIGVIMAGILAVVVFVFAVCMIGAMKR